MTKEIIIAWAMTIIIGFILLYFELLPDDNWHVQILSIVIFIIIFCIVGIINKKFGNNPD